MPSHDVWRYVTFATDLGWMALGGASGRVARLTFGHKTETAARRALGKLPRAVELRLEHRHYGVLRRLFRLPDTDAGSEAGA